MRSLWIMDYGYEWRNEEGISHFSSFIFSVNIETTECEILFKEEDDYLLTNGDIFLLDEWFDDNRW